MNVNYNVGLTAEQVIESRKKHGINILTPPKKESVWKAFLEKFKDPIIVILLIVLGLSISIAIYEFYIKNDFSIFLEPVGILVAILLATVVGFYFELSANKKFEILEKVNDDTAVKLIRDSNICQVPKKDVVVGDIIILETGDEVVADGELLEAISLQINESSLTGEPISKKTTDPDKFVADATYPSNYALKGTTVVDGHGLMCVDKVGDATQYGKVYKGAQIDNSIQTPLNQQLNKLSGLITRLSYAVALLIIIGRFVAYFATAGNFVITDWLHFWNYAVSTIMIAVTLIVVAVPEGLPISITLSLALNMKRMLSTNNLVRKMHSCETMGATTVICTDKTGTLTQNQMRFHDFYHIDNLNENILFEGIAVNSTANLDFSDTSKINVVGNPTEGALLLWLQGKKHDYLHIRKQAQIIEQLTFSTERKYMATIVRSNDKKILYVKGAPEILLNLCKNTQTEIENIHAQLSEYQNRAMRTLGFAYQVIENEDDTTYICESVLQNTKLSFLGIVAISDPIRSDVPIAINDCMSAGIDVKIVTGDTPATAKEIGRQIGLWRDDEPSENHLSGTEFAEMSDANLLGVIKNLKILSRARPLDKQRLVRLLQTSGEVVAVTGDGTNDAPALKAAQVGLSMGDGTWVAKQASDITILDNSFGSISKAVMWGRSLYQNIQRFILFQLTINVAACLIVLIGAFLGTESPLTVVQMLWVNLIMDAFAAMALASLPPSKKVMSEKPRKTTAHIITKAMAHNILTVGILFVVVLFGLLQYFKNTDISSLTQFSVIDFARNFFNFSTSGSLSTYQLTLFFNIFVMLQFWNMFNAKAFMSGKSAFSSINKCFGFVAIAALIIVVQWLIVSFGGEMFNVIALSFTDWLIIIGSTSLVLWIGEIFRFVRR